MRISGASGVFALVVSLLPGNAEPFDARPSFVTVKIAVNADRYGGGPKRKTPNPYGKKGNPDHQERVKEEREQLNKADYSTQLEHPIPTPGGLK